MEVDINGVADGNTLEKHGNEFEGASGGSKCEEVDVMIGKLGFKVCD